VIAVSFLRDDNGTFEASLLPLVIFLLLVTVAGIVGVCRAIKTGEIDVGKYQSRIIRRAMNPIQFRIWLGVVSIGSALAILANLGLCFGWFR
jgi:hypothetical protein